MEILCSELLRNIKCLRDSINSIVPTSVIQRSRKVSYQTFISRRKLYYKTDIQTVSHGDFTVTVMPALGDNYMYLVQPSGKAAAILVDPVDHRLASHQVIKQKTRLESILCTHHHADHDSGNSPLKRIYPEGWLRFLILI